MERSNYTHLIGKRFRMKPSITSRPEYFNDEGKMDKYLDGRTFEVYDVRNTRFGMAFEIKDVSDGYQMWFVKIDDTIPQALDNREVRHASK